MSIEVVRKGIRSPVGADQWLVKDSETDEHFIVSGVHALITGWEVLAFPSDADGNVTDWLEVAGWRGATHEAVIAALAERRAA